MTDTPKRTNTADVAVHALLSDSSADHADLDAAATHVRNLDLVRTFEDLSVAQQDALRLVALKAVNHIDRVVPSRHVNAATAGALIRRDLLTKRPVPLRGYHGGLGYRLTARGAAMTDAVNAPRITYTDLRHTALEFVARGRVTVSRVAVDGVPRLVWLLDGQHTPHRERHLADLWQTAYVTIPGRPDAGFTGGPVALTDDGYALRTRWLTEHGSLFPSERFVPFVTHTVTRDSDGRVYRVLGSELGAVTLLHEGMLDRAKVVQADELAAEYTATGWRPQCQCQGTVACEWYEAGDGARVSMCLRCGKDRERR